MPESGDRYNNAWIKILMLLIHRHQLGTVIITNEEVLAFDLCKYALIERELPGSFELSLVYEQSALARDAFTLENNFLKLVALIIHKYRLGAVAIGAAEMRDFERDVLDSFRLCAEGASDEIACTLRLRPNAEAKDSAARYARDLPKQSQWTN